VSFVAIGVFMRRCITRRAWVSSMGGCIFVNTEWFVTSCYKLLQNYLGFMLNRLKNTNMWR